MSHLDIDYPIVEDPQAEYEESGVNKDVPGLYGSEAMQHALSIDFDGPVHLYESGWQGHETVADGPTPGAHAALWRLHEAGWKLYLHTSRSHLKPVQAWLSEHKFPPMILTRVKPIAVAYVDDRAVRWEGDWESVRKLFV